MRLPKGLGRDRQSGKVSAKPRWVGGIEVPAARRYYPDGTASYYGSGKAVLETSDGSIVMVVPAEWTGRDFVAIPAVPATPEATMALKKIMTQKGGDSPASEVRDRETWPSLREYLHETKYPDGSSREPAVLLILGEVGGWKGCVSDKDNGRTMWKTADTLLGLLEALEEGLTVDLPESWRKASGQPQGRGKKRG